MTTSARRDEGRVLRSAYRLAAAYQRVRIVAAEKKWKPNGNIAASTDSAITVRF
jgi:hypothetical protein